ncbi:7255_t:CDS:2 [Cetraspora pellucida]|uniref:7255_t:CDS:1 n=1 Tax=Cetraspora pellucida TaxID=1433469 RepID=A0A9N8ZTG4_9GLOM|nr:7255_t:CDS:2 [Cetraspora pellucida]
MIKGYILCNVIIDVTINFEACNYFKAEWSVTTTNDLNLKW